MLTEKELEEKLRGCAERFRQKVLERDWGGAKFLYDEAVTVAVVAEMSESFRTELFGYGGRDDYCEANADAGLFRPSSVDRVNLESCIRRNMAYQDRECRRLGVDPEEVRYYSEKDYCAFCRKRKA